MNEAETRAEHIDPALKAAGWGAVGLGDGVNEEPAGRVERRLAVFDDPADWFGVGRLLAFLEAIGVFIPVAGRARLDVMRRPRGAGAGGDRRLADIDVEGCAVGSRRFRPREKDLPAAALRPKVAHRACHGVPGAPGSRALVPRAGHACGLTHDHHHACQEEFMRCQMSMLLHPNDLQ